MGGSHFLVSLASRLLASSLLVGESLAHKLVWDDVEKVLRESEYKCAWFPARDECNVDLMPLCKDFAELTKGDASILTTGIEPYPIDTAMLATYCHRLVTPSYESYNYVDLELSSGEIVSRYFMNRLEEQALVRSMHFHGNLNESKASQSFLMHYNYAQILCTSRGYTYNQRACATASDICSWKEGSNRRAHCATDVLKVASRFQIGIAIPQLVFNECRQFTGRQTCKASDKIDPNTFHAPQKLNILLLMSAAFFGLFTSMLLLCPMPHHSHSFYRFRPL